MNLQDHSINVSQLWHISTEVWIRTAADIACCKQLFNTIKSSRNNDDILFKRVLPIHIQILSLTEEYAAKIVAIRTKKYISTDPHT